MGVSVDRGRKKTGKQRKKRGLNKGKKKDLKSAGKKRKGGFVG